MLFLQTGKPFAREAVNRGRLCCEHACRPGLPSEKSHFAYDCALRHPAQFMLLIFACPGEDGDGPFCYNIDGICRASRKIKRGTRLNLARNEEGEKLTAIAFYFQLGRQPCPEVLRLLQAGGVREHPLLGPSQGGVVMAEGARA